MRMFSGISGSVLVGLFLVLVSTSAFAVKVACVGNSITEGFGLEADEPKYPDYLQQMMNAGDTVANFGSSGRMFFKKSTMSYWVEEEFEEALAFPSDIVVIELGTNDSKYFYLPSYDLTVKSLQPSYEELVETFASRPRSPEIFATLQPYANHPEGGIVDSVMVKYINPLIKGAAMQKGANIIDLHTLFSPKLLLSDSLHPNSEGAKEIAKIVHKYITMPKPKMSQKDADLVVEKGFGFRWYKDSVLISGAENATLPIKEKGIYRALVKVEEDNDSWLLTDEVQIKKLPPNSTKKTGIERKARNVEPRPHKLKHRVDVKGRRAP